MFVYNWFKFAPNIYQTSPNICQTYAKLYQSYSTRALKAAFHARSQSQMSDRVVFSHRLHPGGPIY